MLRAVSLIAPIIALLFSAQAQAAVRSVTLQKPARDFGYLLGDTLTATAIVAVDPGTQLDRTSLPQPGPVSRLIDVRTVAVSETTRNGAPAYRIEIQYQSFFGPDAATTADIPGFRIDFTDGPSRIAAQVPAWRFMASPLRHAVAVMTDVHGLQPDHAPAPQPDDAAKFRMFAGLAASIAGACVLLVRGGWLSVPGAGHRPFTAAARRMSRHRRDADAPRRAFIIVHQAFDKTAGRTILAGDIDAFTARHTRFLALRADIERFFAASQAHFFGNAASPTKTGNACTGSNRSDFDWLAAFTRRLGRAERG